MSIEFALFYVKRELCWGLIETREDRQCYLRLPDGEMLRYPADKLLFCWQGHLAQDAEPVEPLEILKQAAAQLAEPPADPPADLKTDLKTDLKIEPPVDLKTLHRRLPKGRDIPFAQIAATSRISPQGWPAARLYRALLKTPGLFRPERDGFAARGAVERQHWEARQAQLREQAHRREQAGVWRAALERGETPRGEEWMAFAAQLQSLLVEGRHSPHWELLAPALGLGRKRMEEGRQTLKRWLEAGACWPGWPTLWLRQAGLNPVFPAALQEAAAALAAALDSALDTAPASTTSKVHTAPAYTIDPPGSLDLDDALSLLTEDALGLTLAIHITRPPDLLAPGNPLFEEAAERMASLYIPEGVCPMFPPTLSEGRFSLLAGQEREVASFILRLDEEGGRLLEVEATRLAVRANLDYEAGQTLLTQASWGRMEGLCLALRRQRAAAGAQLNTSPEVIIDASDSQRPHLQERERGSGAQLVIEELAILLNREVGRYFRAQALPAIYRVQPQGSNRGGRYSTRGAPHAGLGCDRYAQISSPIRRFTDLVMQQQLLGHVLKGRITHPETGQLRRWAQRAEMRKTVQAVLGGQITRYWKRVYLARQTPAAWQGVVKRTSPADASEHPSAPLKGKVWLEALQLLVDAELPPGARREEKHLFRLKWMHPEHQQALLTPEPPGPHEDDLAPTPRDL